TTTCNLDDGRQLYVHYNAVSSKEKPANGKPWAPGGAPMTLFTEAQLTLGSSMIPIGAYRVYPIPARDHWTLVVNKNVAPGATYLRTLDGRRTWTPAQVSDAATLDFRAVVAFSADEAFLMSAGLGEQSRIFHTSDGGKHWQLQFTNTNPKGFFDSMVFSDSKH